MAEDSNESSYPFPVTLEAITQHQHNKAHLDESAMLSGWLLQACLSLIEQSSKAA